MGQARDVAQRFYDSFSAGDLDAAMANFADSCVTVTPAGSLSNEEHEAFGRAFKDALPDARMDVIRAVESGDEVYVRGRFKGTHQGDLVTAQGAIPASGNSLDLPFVDYFRVADGKVVAHEVCWDQMDMMRQLGAGPPQ
jgi:steroid delta-isomerase-like uncharacterized protein